MLNHEETLLINDFNFSYDFNANNLSILSQEKKYEISGPSALDIYNVLKNITENFKMENILEQNEFTESYLFEILAFLEEKKIIYRHLNLDEVSSELYRYINNNVSSLKSVQEIEKDIINIRNKKIGLIGDSDLLYYFREEMQNYWNLELIENLDEINESLDIYIILYTQENIEKFIEFNKLCQKKNLNFLRVVLSDQNIEIGPLVVPKETVCYECFITRIISNNKQPEFFLNYNKFPNNHKQFLSKDSLLISKIYIKQQLINVFSELLNSDLYYKELIYNFQENNTTDYRVLKIPNCRYCDNKQIEFEREKVWTY